MSAVSNHDGLLGLVVSVTLGGLDSVEHLQTLNDLSEDNMSTIEVGSVDEAEEELATVGAWASVRHRKDTAARVLVGEVLVFELSSVDGLATCAVSSSEVSTLGHEICNHAVEEASLVVKRLA